MSHRFAFGQHAIADGDAEMTHDQKIDYLVLLATVHFWGLKRPSPREILSAMCRHRGAEGVEFEARRLTPHVQYLFRRATA